MADQKRLAAIAGAPVARSLSVAAAGPHAPMLLHHVCFLEKLPH
jgi:catalase